MTPSPKKRGTVFDLFDIERESAASANEASPGPNMVDRGKGREIAPRPDYRPGSRGVEEFGPDSSHAWYSLAPTKWK